MSEKAEKPDMPKTRAKLITWGEYLGGRRPMLRTMPDGGALHQLQQLRMLVSGTQAIKPEGPVPEMAIAQQYEMIDQIWFLRTSEAVLGLPDCLQSLVMTMYPPGWRRPRSEVSAARMIDLDLKELRRQRGIAEAAVSCQLFGRIC